VFEGYVKFNIPFCPDEIVCVLGVIVSVPVTGAGVGVVVVVGAGVEVDGVIATRLGLSIRRGILSRKTQRRHQYGRKVMSGRRFRPPC